MELPCSQEVSETENVLTRYLREEIGENDAQWLAAYGFDVGDVVTCMALRALVSEGSQSIVADTDRVLEARRVFFGALGLQTVVDAPDVSDTIVPLNTFVCTQRLLGLLGVDVKRVTNAHPMLATYSYDSVLNKLEALIANNVNAIKMVNECPSLLGYAPQTIVFKMETFAKLGITAEAIENYPTMLTYAADSMREKLATIEQFGISPTAIVNGCPNVLGLSPELVSMKIRFLQRTCCVLGWQHSAGELIERAPIILTYSLPKLQILRRLAAERLSISSRNASLSEVAEALRVPLEKYLLVDSNKSGVEVDVSSFKRQAKRLKYNAPTRKKLAAERIGQLGRVGRMYANYARIEVPS